MGKAIFLQYCGLTCMGGSDVKQCECLGPDQCELKNHPGFPAARQEAKERMLRHLNNAIVETADKAVTSGQHDTGRPEVCSWTTKDGKHPCTYEDGHEGRHGDEEGPFCKCGYKYCRPHEHAGWVPY